MKKSKKVKTNNYFEEEYLGKTSNGISVIESRRLQKLLTVKALISSVRAGGVSQVNYKRMTTSKTPDKFIMDIDGFLLPFDL